MADMDRKTATDERGAAAVEFALILPLLVLMLVGIMDMGRMVYIRSILESAARAGAQAAFADPGATATIEAAVQTAALAGGVTVTSVTAPEACRCSDASSVDCATGTCATGSVHHYVTVTTTKAYTPMVNLANLPFGLGIDLTTTLTAKVVMRAQ